MRNDILNEFNPAWLEGYADGDERRTYWFGGISQSTEWRWERDGIIPRSEIIGPNRKGTKRRKLLEWADDPTAWRKKHGVSVLPPTGLKKRKAIDQGDLQPE